jgi:hypothetical protein
MTKVRFNLCDVWPDHKSLPGKYDAQLLLELLAVWKASEEQVLQRERDRVVENAQVQC